MPKVNEVRPERWSQVIDLYDDGDYSAVWGSYDGSEVRRLGVRWNGDEGYAGYPNQGGNPLWYAEPDFMTKPILLRLLEMVFSHPDLSRKAEYVENINTALQEACISY